MVTQTEDALLSRADFAAAAGEWLQANVPTRWREHRGSLEEDEQNEIRREWDRILFGGGYAGLSLPKEYGGQGLGVAEEVVFAQLAAKAQAPDGLSRIGRILAAPTLVVHGTEHQLSTYLVKILNGDEIWCQGFSEPSAGSDLAGVSTTAAKVEGGYVINGRKTWTSFARLADRCLLLARTGPAEARHKNLTMFLLDMRQPGVDISPIRQISGLSHFAETTFTDAFVADADVVAGEGDGWKVAMTVLQNERGGVEAASRYVEIRADLDLLTATIGDDPRYRDRLQEFDTRLEVVQWQITKTIDRDPDSTEFFRSASVLKLMWSELWQEITTLGLETATARTFDHWQFQYFETRASSVYSGTSEIQRNIISERVLGLPRR